MFEESIFVKIVQAWESDQKHPLRDRLQKAPPDIKDLQAIVETSFWASLRREEGRLVLFSAALLSQTQLEDHKRSSRQREFIMPFSEPLPLTEQGIVKLAPAFDFKAAALLAGSVNEDKTAYEIWGIAFFSPTMKRIGDERKLFRPDVLTVSTVSPGSLLIGRGDAQLGRFIKGEFIRATPTPFYSKAMGQYIVNSIKNNEGYVKYQNYYWQIYNGALEHLLAEASARSHGATIVVLPKKEIERYERGIRSKYSFRGDLGIGDAIMKVLEGMKMGGEFDAVLSMRELEKNCSERLDTLAQLCCVDGALVLSTDLEVRSFGSTLVADKWPGEVLVGPDGFGGGGEKFDVSKLGTRHNSAVNFIGAFPGSFGFVLSQDGPIRGLVRKDETTVLCWPDCSVSMFL